MATQQVSTLITDTCSAYKLFFFISEKIIPEFNIIIPNLGKIEFHPIVLTEFDNDLAAYHLFKNLNLKPKWKGYPNFFDTLGHELLPKIESFIKGNLTKLATTSPNDKKFIIQRKIYDDYRIQLQNQWQKENKYQASQKSISEPTDEDYLLLYDALKNKIELVTNDEILLAVANHFLGVQVNKMAYMAEHVIHAVYSHNTHLKVAIEDCVKNLNYLNEKFQLNLVF